MDHWYVEIDRGKSHPFYRFMTRNSLIHTCKLDILGIMRSQFGIQPILNLNRSEPQNVQRITIYNFTQLFINEIYVM